MRLSYSLAKVLEGGGRREGLEGGWGLKEELEGEDERNWEEKLEGIGRRAGRV